MIVPVSLKTPMVVTAASASVIVVTAVRSASAEQNSTRTGATNFVGFDRRFCGSDFHDVTLMIEDEETEYQWQI